MQELDAKPAWMVWEIWKLEVKNSRFIPWFVCLVFRVLLRSSAIFLCCMKHDGHNTSRKWNKSKQAGSPTVKWRKNSYFKTKSGIHDTMVHPWYSHFYFILHINLMKFSTRKGNRIHTNTTFDVMYILYITTKGVLVCQVISLDFLMNSLTLINMD